jgi:hypothetical protein
LYRDLARRLALNGIAVERLARPTTLDVEIYRVTDKEVAAATVEGHVRVAVRTELVRRRVSFAAGSLIVGWDSRMRSSPPSRSSPSRRRAS